MDDKEFDKIIQKYKSTTVRGKDFDLQKVNYQEKSSINSARLISKIAITSILGIMLIVLIVSAIIFPKVFRQEESEQLHYYSNNGDIKFEMINDTTDMDSIIMPQIDNKASYQLISRVEDDYVLGVQIDYFIYDEVFDDITIYSMKKNHLLLIMEEYLHFQDSIVWNDFKVTYKTSYNIDWYRYETKIFFSDDKYNYFIIINYYEELEINQLLEFIY